MMKKLCVLVLCLLMLATLLPLPAAQAIVRKNHFYVYVAGGDNEKTLEFERLEGTHAIKRSNVLITYPFNVRQIAPQIVRVMPDYGWAEVRVKLGVEALAYDPDGSNERRVPISGLAEGFTNPDFTVKDGILYIDHALYGGEIVEYLLADAIGTSTGSIAEEYSPSYIENGFTHAADLSLAVPEQPGIAMEPSSKPDHLMLTLPKGTPLSAMSAFQARLGIEKMSLSEASGFYTQGEAKTFLPVSDEATLARYPELKDAALITLMAFDAPNKITHYAVVEVHWK